MKILGKIFPEGTGDKKNIYRIIGMLALGVILLVFSNFISPSKENPNKETIDNGKLALEDDAIDRDYSQEGNISYEKNIEQRLEEILQRMQGVGEVKVMITTTYGREMVVAEDITNNVSDTFEQDTEGGVREVKNHDNTRKIVMETGDMSSGNKPVVLKEKEPKVQGVLIISEGANNSFVKESIIDSAKNLLDIPVHKISVYKLEK